MDPGRSVVNRLDPVWSARWNCAASRLPQAVEPATTTRPSGGGPARLSQPALDLDCPNGLPSAAGTGQTFTIHAIAHDGNPVTAGGANFTASITGPGAVTPVVTDNGDGTYTVTYTAPTRGSPSTTNPLGWRYRCDGRFRAVRWPVRGWRDQRWNAVVTCTATYGQAAKRAPVAGPPKPRPRWTSWTSRFHRPEGIGLRHTAVPNGHVMVLGPQTSQIEHIALNFLQTVCGLRGAHLF